MREILFRGRRFDNGEWAQGVPLFCDRDGSIMACQNASTGGLDIAVVEPSTVGQYTGMKDCNGAKIFEGDMLKCANVGDKITYRVVWDKGTAGWSVVWSGDEKNDIGSVDTMDNWDPEDWGVVTE